MQLAASLTLLSIAAMAALASIAADASDTEGAGGREGPGDAAEREVAVIPTPMRDNHEWIYESRLMRINFFGLHGGEIHDVDHWRQYRIADKWQAVGFFDSNGGLSLLFVLPNGVFEERAPVKVEIGEWPGDTPAGGWLMRHESDDIEEAEHDWREWLAKAEAEQNQVVDVFALKGKISVETEDGRIKQLEPVDTVRTRDDVSLDQHRLLARIESTKRQIQRARRAVAEDRGYKPEKWLEQEQKALEDLMRAGDAELQPAKFSFGSIRGRWRRTDGGLDLLLP